MSRHHQLAIASIVLTLFSTGCCLTRPCGLAGFCGELPGMLCDETPCDAGNCSASPRAGCLLGLGCIGKLLRFSSYGACNGGCGEVY